MPKKPRQLPEPPGGPFKRKKAFGEEAETPQTADRLTAAMMEGRMDEFMDEEFGDIPGAKELAMMMLGATGMSPTSVSPQSGKEKKPAKQPAAKASKKTVNKPAKKPEDVLSKSPESNGPNFDKADIDTLMKIAAENNVSFDWVMARAIKLYARDYRTTGRI